MRKLPAASLAALIAALAACTQPDAGQPRGAAPETPVGGPPGGMARGASAAADPGDTRLQEAIRNRRRDVQVTGSGTVVRVLGDDRRGSRHQRFIVQLPSGETVLVAHNIDLAKRLQSLDPGEQVDFFGEYEWTDQGGVVHWTHRDPDGRHVAGWLRHEGTMVQ